MLTIQRIGRADGAGWAALAIGAVTWAITLRPITAADLTDVGLVSGLPVGWWVAAASVTVAFGLACRTDTVNMALGAASIVALAVILYATPAVSEALPRFNTVYVHLGLIDAIVRTGQLFPELDARFSWPLFFAGSAAITTLSGVDLIRVAAWVPVLTILAALPAMLALTRAFSSDSRLALLATWVLVLGNWVGQDYLSPQGFNFILYLWFLAIVAVFFGRRAPAWEPLRGRLGRLIGTPLAPPVVGYSSQRPAVRIAMLFLLLAIVMTSAASHQLTPFAMVGASLGLLAVGRTSLRSLPILISVIAGLWVVFVGYSFLAGHLVSLLEDLGNPTGAAGSGVVERVRGSSGHVFVVVERIAYSAAFLGAGLVGLIRRLRAGHWDLAAVALAVVPFALIALQSYGGEIFLRVYLFALPATSFLVAAAILPSGRIPGVMRAGLIVVVSLAMTWGFTVARYGNERADLVEPGELAIVDRTLAVVPPDSLVALLNYNAPVRYRLFEQYDYLELTRPAGGFTPDDIARQIDEVRRARPGFLLVTRGQEALEELVGTDRSALDRLRILLEGSSRFTVELETDAGILYRYVPRVQP